MNNLLKYVKTQIPKEIDGFTCIKTQDIFIPYLDIGIECLIRDISDISLFFETILKLVEVGVTNISEIAYLLGVTEEVINQVIVDMVSSNNDYVNVSENSLKITNKGKEALATRKTVSIRTKNLSKVAINLVTGEIFDGTTLRTSNVNKSSICLPETIAVNKRFLESHFSLINDIFQAQQENNTIYGRQATTKELYKIVDIYYRNLVYTKNQIFVYKSNTSDDLQIKFATDKNDKYVNCLYDQLKTVAPPCLEPLFVHSKKISNTSTRMNTLDLKLKAATESAKDELKNKDVVNIDVTKIKTKRYALYDKEYMAYFTYSDDLDFEKIIIYTNMVGELLNGQVAKEIARICNEKPVFIIYDKNEYNADKSINYYSDIIKSTNFHIIPCETVNRNVICFSRYLMIEIEEQFVKSFDREMSFITSVFDFDCSNQNIWIEEMKKLFPDVFNTDNSSAEKNYVFS